MTQQFQSTAEIQAQAESARKREIDFPMTLIGAGYVLGCGALIWAGFANPDAFGRLSDSLVTLFFIAATLLTLAMTILNVALISLTAGLRRTLPEKLGAANEKVQSAGPIVLEAMNRLADPLIRLIANYSAVAALLKRKKAAADTTPGEEDRSL